MVFKQHANFSGYCYIYQHEFILFVPWKTVSKNKCKSDLHIQSTFIAMTDNSMKHLVVVSSILRSISPIPYFCFARMMALSTAIRTALSLYSVFCRFHHFSFVCHETVCLSGFRAPCNKQSCFYFGRFYLP